MTYKDIAGWVDYETAIDEAVDHFPDGSLFVEVGAYLGRSAVYFAESIRRSGKRIRFVSVDTCRGSGVENEKDNHGDAVRRGGHTFVGELHNNLIACGVADLVTLLVTDSLSAAALFADNSIDFVFLDARHDYESVKSDIAAWLPKTRAWIGGDDYCEIWPGVIRAVNELLPGAKPWSHDSWRYVKP